MVALFVAFTFVFFVTLDLAYTTWLKLRKNTVRRADERDGVYFVPDLGQCMADGGEPIKKETK